MKNGYYEISKKGSWYTVKSEKIVCETFVNYNTLDEELTKIFGKRTYSSKTRIKYKKLDFVIERDIKDLRQADIALITTEMDGTHSIYLPKINNESGTIETFLIMDNVIQYQYFDNLLLIIFKNEYCFLYLKECSKMILEKRGSNYVLIKDFDNLNDNLKEIEKFPFDCKPPYIKGKYRYKNSYIISVESGKDYAVIQNKEYGAKYTTLTYMLHYLGKTEYLYSDLVKVITNDGKQYIPQNNISCEEELYDEINPFTDSEYSLVKGIFDDDSGQYYGYWFINYSPNGNMYQMRIYSKGNYIPMYILDFEKKIPKFDFVSRLNFKSQRVDVWKIINEPDLEEKILIRCGNEQKYIELDKFKLGITT